MKIHAEVSKLMPEIDFIARHAATRTTIPILSFLRIEMAGGKLTMDSTGLEKWASVTMDAEGDDGAVAVHAAAISRFFRALPKGATAEISTDGAALSVSAGRASATFSTLPADDFPKPTENRPKPQPIDAEALCAALNGAVVAAADGSDARYYLGGVYLSRDHAVATDGHQMTVFGLPQDYGVILPREFVADVTGLLAGGGEFGANESGWIARAGGRELFGKTVDGAYPDWERIDVPANPVAMFGRDALADAIKIATLGTGCPVILVGGNGVITVSAKPSESRWDASTQDASSSADAETKSEFRVMVNGKYLSNALGIMPDAEIALTISDAGHMIRLEPVDGSAFLARRAAVATMRG